MMLAYSRLRGMPVVTVNGQCLGRVADIFFQRSGKDAVAVHIVVARNKLGLIASRFGTTRGLFTIDADRIAEIDGKHVWVRPASERR